MQTKNCLQDPRNR